MASAPEAADGGAAGAPEALPSVPSAGGRVEIVGGRLLLPDGSLTAGDLALEGDRITEVGGKLGHRAGARVLEARGCTVMPGMVDLHSHLTLVLRDHEGPDTSRSVVALRASRQALRALRTGITRCRDIGGYQHVDIELRDAIREGVVPGPAMACAGQFIAITGGHAWPYTREADGEGEVRKAAREQIRAGADFLKIVGSGGVRLADDNETAVQFSLGEMSAMVEEASAAGTVAAAHVHPERAIRNAVTAGVRSVEHGTHLTPEIAEMMLERSVFLVPTFAITRFIAAHDPSPMMRAWAERTIVTKREMFRMVLDKGLAWGIGTDAGSYLPSSAIVDEMRAICELGLSAGDVLQHVTRHNADLWGWSDAGRLASGCVADVLVVRGDPTEDLGAMRQVEITVARGAVFDWRELAADGPPSR